MSAGKWARLSTDTWWPCKDLLKLAWSLWRHHYRELTSQREFCLGPTPWRCWCICCHKQLGAFWWYSGDRDWEWLEAPTPVLHIRFLVRGRGRDSLALRRHEHGWHHRDSLVWCVVCSLSQTFFSSCLSSLQSWLLQRLLRLTIYRTRKFNWCSAQWDIRFSISSLCIFFRNPLKYIAS